jgi:tRNA threonylcarbamoyladenosine biosynthesis protein TsaB
MDDNWLILETSGRIGKVGLARGGAVVSAVSLDDNRRHARDLTSTVQAVLKAETLAPRDLTGVMVGWGPGSYTGLRVGIMSAKALAFALGCELRAVETFAAIAQQTPAEARSVWVIADALQGQVYAQQFTRRDNGWFAATALQIESVMEWAALLRPGDFVSGPGITIYAELIPLACRLVSEVDREARVESVFAVGIRLSPLAREELLTLEPLYLRGSSAEEKTKGK